MALNVEDAAKTQAKTMPIRQWEDLAQRSFLFGDRRNPLRPPSRLVHSSPLHLSSTAVKAVSPPPLPPVTLRLMSSLVSLCSERAYPTSLPRLLLYLSQHRSFITPLMLPLITVDVRGYELPDARRFASESLTRHRTTRGVFKHRGHYC